MGRPAKKKSATALATEKAKKAYDTAAELYAKSAAPADIEKVKKLRDAYDEAKRFERRDRFTTVAGQRVDKVIATLQSLAACARPSSYDYTEHDIKKAWDVMGEAFADAHNKLTEGLHRKTDEPKRVGQFRFD